MSSIFFCDIPQFFIRKKDYFHYWLLFYLSLPPILSLSFIYKYINVCIYILEIHISNTTLFQSCGGWCWLSSDTPFGKRLRAEEIADDDCPSHRRGQSETACGVASGCRRSRFITCVQGRRPWPALSTGAVLGGPAYLCRYGSG